MGTNAKVLYKGRVNECEHAGMSAGKMELRQLEGQKQTTECDHSTQLFKLYLRKFTCQCDMY